jgi:biotin-(acetyl-CoA carboxylase) ligase
MATPYVTVICNVAASTQDLAVAEMRSRGVPVLVVAAEQTAGRGRSGNVWWQATRGVAASLAFSPNRVPVVETLPLAVGLAVRRAVAIVLDVAVALKWPNDLERAGRKVGGILVERSDDNVVVGCGLNLFWPDAPEGAGGLVDSDPGSDPGIAISESWATRVLEDGGHWDREDYLAACTTVGLEVTWEPAGRGTALTVDDRGGLVVATEAGETTLRSGQVNTVRPTR